MDWDIIGHEWAVDLLSQQIAHGRIHHAYLITGPEGIGRRILALRLAQALNCPTSLQPGRPCLTCSTCTRIARMQHPDLIVIQAAADSKLLKVEQVREIQHNLVLAPYEAKYKIAMFLNFQDALASVPNALLKTLEEPPARVIIILIADDPDNLLPTITSRCEIIRLRPLSIDQAALGLQERWGLPEEQARLLAHISGGLPVAALSMNEQPDYLQQRSRWLGEFCSLLAASRVEKFRFTRLAKDEKDTLRVEFHTWVSFWRDVLLTIVGSSIPLTNPDWVTQIQEIAVQVDFSQACQFLSLLEAAINRIEYSNINLQLALEALLLSFPHLRVSNLPASF